MRHRYFFLGCLALVAAAGLTYLDYGGSALMAAWVGIGSLAVDAHANA